ncbi:MAG: phosphoribosylformylglycinamidine cyclo-ligase, partial [Planctomycetota bacterium]
KAARADIRSTFTPGVLGDVGLFGGLFDASRVGCGDHVLVASADGVGTKIDVARRARRYDTLGHDIVNHCINDILVQGARPLFFLDYVASGRFEPPVFAELIRGLAAACKAHEIALLGGETAEMPGTYKDGDFDLAGFIVGAVERQRILDGSRIRPGQVLLGLASSGLHTNGYSLARKVLFDVLKLEVSARPPELGGKSVGEALLEPHRAYLEALWPLLQRDRIAALVHITGGGIPGNVPRVLGGSFDALIDRRTWEVPPLFRMIVQGGDVARDEAYRVFNMGLGMVLFVEPSEAAAVRADLQGRGHACWELGRIEAGTGSVRYLG